MGEMGSDGVKTKEREMKRKKGAEREWERGDGIKILGSAGRREKGDRKRC